ncbi:hypothetical protein B0H11DRAFT_2222095 [Mycena galericulata]|nr:hypothetical protein B0H11DRAFT_2222095 [Mycena galericulata]
MSSGQLVASHPSESIKISGLREHVEAIASMITVQREVLRELEKKKSDVQSQLNAILDPIARLPLELSVDIFMRCLPDSFYPDKRYAPMLLLNVCRSWTNIALSTPSLWAAIDIECPRENEAEFSKLMDLWFARSRTRPLSVSLHGAPDMGDLDPRVPAAIQRAAGRVENLQLYLHSEDLERMKMPLPSLKTFVIGRGPETEGTYDHDTALDMVTCIAILCAASNLVECTFDRVRFQGQDDVTSISRHSTLRRLQLGEDRSVEGSADVLRYLTLPSLERLSISHFDIECDTFLHFLARSSPPLQSLSIHIAFEWSLEQVDSICRLLPSLTHLELQFARSTDSYSAPPGDYFPIFTLLGTSSQGILPNLRNLTMNGYAPGHPQYKQLLTMLSARSSRLKTFRLVVHKTSRANRPRSPDVKPQAGIVKALQGLVAAGMKIHVGRQGCNWICA